MALPEAQGNLLSTEEQHMRWGLFWNPGDLTMAEHASLIEHYEDAEWLDEETVQFYDRIFAEINSHPGEFFAAATTYEHGFGVELLLPEQGSGIIRPKTIGDVVLEAGSLTDLSVRAPQLSSFSRGAEIFVSANPDTPADVRYRAPSISLTDARLNRGRGTNPPLNIELLAGNKAIAGWIESQLLRGSISEQEGLEIVLAAAMIAEAHNTAPVVVAALSDEIPKVASYHEWQESVRRSHLASNTRLLGQLAALAASIEQETEVLAEEYQQPEGVMPTTSMHIWDSRTWPYTTIADRGFELNRIRAVSEALAGESGELQRQLPLIGFYLAAIRRYTQAALR